MTRGDRIVLAVILLTAIVSIPVSLAFGGSKAQVATITAPFGETVVDLGSDASYEIQGRSGTVAFEVRDGRITCVGSSCEDHVCVEQGAASAGCPIVCAPNGVVAVLSPGGSGEAELDAVSR